MSGLTERLRNFGDIPGHLFRDTRERERDRHSVITGISNRVIAVKNLTSSTDMESEHDALLRREHVEGRIRRLRYMDWGSREQVADFEGEPVSSRAHLSSKPDIESHMGFPTASDTRLVIVKERLVYSRGEERPTIGERLWQAWVTRKVGDIHAALDDPKATQAQRISEALRNERQGTLTARWLGYLRSMRQRVTTEFNIAIRSRS